MLSTRDRSNSIVLRDKIPDLMRMRRFVTAISVAFLFKDAIIPPAYLFGRLFFKNIVVDSAGMEEIVQNSGLDWTIVRPPRLTDGPRTGKYRQREGHLPILRAVGTCP